MHLWKMINVRFKKLWDSFYWVRYHLAFIFIAFGMNHSKE